VTANARGQLFGLFTPGRAQNQRLAHTTEAVAA
jgi:hypothetical protein